MIGASLVIFNMVIIAVVALQVMGDTVEVPLKALRGEYSVAQVEESNP